MTLQSFYWSVRRELWENRSLYLAPLAAAAVFLVGFLVSTIYLPETVRSFSTMDAEHQRTAITSPYNTAAGLIMVTAMIVGAFYSAGALNGERRDRSILFWKSLPVSDLTTVLAKASIPILVLPLLCFAITFVLQFAMLAIGSVVVWISGTNLTEFWAQLPFIRMSFLLFYHLLMVHGLWHAPIYAWLLMFGAWARRAAILWAVVPVVASAFIEKLWFNTSHLLSMLDYRLGGGMDAITMPDTLPMDAMTQPTPLLFFTSRGLWIGFALTAIFLTISVRLRHDREPI